MEWRQIASGAGQETYILVFDTGDEVASALLGFAKSRRLSSASFTGIGAFSAVTLGYFDLERKDYERIPIPEQVEVLSLAGNIALAGAEPKVHAHVVVGKRDGTAHGGHLLDARVRPTLELVLTENAPHLRRTIDDRTGLALIALARADE